LKSENQNKSEGAAEEREVGSSVVYSLRQIKRAEFGDEEERDLPVAQGVMDQDSDY
jgi:hypothetical protein